MEKFSMTLVCNPQLQEHLDHEFGAQYDDVRERYANEIQDMRNYEESEREHYEYMQKVYEAGFGDDDQAYENSWKRTEAYFNERNLN